MGPQFCPLCPWSFTGNQSFVKTWLRSFSEDRVTLYSHYLQLKTYNSSSSAEVWERNLIFVPAMNLTLGFCMYKFKDNHGAMFSFGEHPADVPSHVQQIQIKPDYS